MNKKACTRCKIEKEINEFGLRSGRTDGHNSWCKECNNHHTQNYKHKNPDKRKETARNYYYRNRSYYKQYLIDNRQRIKEVRKRRKEYAPFIEQLRYRRNISKPGARDKERRRLAKWRSEHRELIAVRSRKYKQQNKDKIAEYGHWRRASIKGVGGDYSRSEWKKTLELFGSRCVYCGKFGRLTQDHFIPLKLGGGHHANNIVPACISCNSKKNRTHPSKWIVDKYSESKYLSIKHRLESM